MTDAVKLYGTHEVEPPARLLQAGPLDVTLDRGGLRRVRWRGREVLRGIHFIVRTPGWATAAPEISDLVVEAGAERFSVRYRGDVTHGEERLAYTVTVDGEAGGRLSARATFVPGTDFTTNRTGFVVLHQLDGFAGNAVAVAHANGPGETLEMPGVISPGQPAMDIAGLRYRPAEDVEVDIRFEGEVFEMEDQRNWTDASFKTYCRPIGLPYPYVLAAHEPVTQGVTLSVAEAPAAAGIAAEPGGDGVTVRLGAPGGVRLPPIGLCVEVAEAEAALAFVPEIDALRLDHLAVRLDLSREEPARLTEVARLAEALGLPVVLDIILTAPAGARPEIEVVAAAARAASLRLAAVAGFPKVDEISFQPGEPRPPSPPLEAIQAELRTAFPGVRIGGGTPAFFTELNRKRPPVAGLDYVTHATCPIVHAADDFSVMETLETLPWIVASARSFSGGKGYRIGLAGIGARLNPYGKGTQPNPGNGRVALAQADPRQRGLFGAAWLLGYAAGLAPHGLEALSVAAPAGPFGLVHTPQDYAQPWYDALGRPAVFPLYHVVADLAEAGRTAQVPAKVSDGRRVAALAWHGEAGPELLLANLTAETQSVTVEGLAGWTARLLDEAAFEAAATDWSDFRTTRTAGRGPIRLPPYATARIRAA